MKARLAALIVCAASPAYAGMPINPFQRLYETTRLTSLAQMRLASLAFFLLVFLGLAWVFMRVWNGFRADLPVLPQLSYRRALGFLFVWTLAMSSVLSMITGARELMTPGAWERSDAVYRVGGIPAGAGALSREANLQRLGQGLVRWAATHGGRFPANSYGSEVPAEQWRTPTPAGDPYVYLGAQTLKPGDVPRILAFEPATFGDRRYALFTDGSVLLLSWREIEQSYEKDMKARLPELVREAR